MLQRIQSIFLVGVSICAAFTFFGEFASFFSGGKGYVFNAFGISNLDLETNYARVFSISIFSFLALLALLPLVSIFQYKNRKNQLKIGYFLMAFSGAVFVSALYYIFGISGFIPNDGNIEVTYGFGLIWPLIAFILSFLANHYINKDEALIRSMDRLR